MIVLAPMDAPLRAGEASPLRSGDRRRRELEALKARRRRSPARSKQRRDHPQHNDSFKA